MYTHPDVVTQLAKFRNDELHRSADEARLAASIKRDRRTGAEPDEVVLAGHSFRILRRRRIWSVPKPRV